MYVLSKRLCDGLIVKTNRVAEWKYASHLELPGLKKTKQNRKHFLACC